MEYGVVKMQTSAPPTQGKRPYRQRLRAESVAQTRQRIVDAARASLTTPPLRTFNLSEVAERAGVVRSTIYAVFGSRVGLLRAVMDDVAERGGWERMRQAYRQPDALTAILDSIEAGTRMAATEHPVITAITALAAVDPDAAVVAAEERERRTRGLDTMLKRLEDQGYLRTDLDRDEALDILYILSSFRTFDQLYTERGLDHPAAVDRLVRLVTSTLCRPEALPPSGVNA
jgi:AcrR family transcriptional regulator